MIAPDGSVGKGAFAQQMPTEITPGARAIRTGRRTRYASATIATAGITASLGES
jgi:hypothetical protein